MKVLYTCSIGLTTLLAFGFAHKADEKAIVDAGMLLRRCQEQVVNEHKVLVQQLPFSVPSVSGQPPGEACDCPPCLSFSINCYSDDLVCPLVYAPVCGCDGVTYENECFAKILNCVPCVTNGACVTIDVHAFAVPGPPISFSTTLPPVSVPQSLSQSVPEVPSFGVQIPSLSVPVPPLSVPAFSAPELSTFSVPPLSLPGVPSFSVQYPSLSVPLSLPGLSSYSTIPPLSVPELSTFSAPLSLPLVGYEMGSFPFEPPEPQCDFCPLPIFGCCKIPPAICNRQNINCNIPEFIPLPPVCGCDGKTYDNACEALFTNCVRCWTRGACPVNTASAAALAAPREAAEWGSMLRRRQDQAVNDHRMLVQQLSFSAPSVSGTPPVPGPPTSFSNVLPSLSVPQSLSLSLSDVPSFSVNVPSLSVLSTSVPEYSTSALSRVSAPYSTPEAPSFSAQYPSLSLPTFSGLPVSLPTLSTFSAPPLSLPQVPSFSVEIPSLSVPVPSLSVPAFSVPELSTFSAQLSSKLPPVPPFSLPLVKGKPGPKGMPAPA